MARPTAGVPFGDLLRKLKADVARLEAMIADAGFGDAEDYVLVDGSRAFTATPNVNGDQIWHAGNDGEGSGLDADTMQGLGPDSFLRKDQDDATEKKLATGIATAHAQAQFHVKKGSAGGNPTWNGNEVMLIEGSALKHVVLAILSAANKRGGIAFADPDAPVMGGLSYDHSDEKLRLFTENVVRLILNATTATFAQALEIPEQSAPGTPGSGYFRIYVKTDGKIYGKNAAGTEYDLTATGSGGTVSSVGLSLPAIFSVSGSPVTTTGTLTGSLSTQSANQVWAGPSSGSAAAPAFRALVAADIPSACLKEPLGHDNSAITGATNHWKFLDTELGGTTVADSKGSVTLAYNFAAECYGRPWYSSQGQMYVTPANQVYINSGLATWITQAKDNNCGVMFWICIPGEDVASSFVIIGPHNTNETEAWNRPFLLELDAGNYLLYTHERNAGVDVTARCPITPGIHHVGVKVTRSGTTSVEFFIDGESARVTTGLTNLTGGSSWVDASTKFIAYYPADQQDQYAMRIAVADMVWFYGSSQPAASEFRTQYRRGKGYY